MSGNNNKLTKPCTRLIIEHKEQTEVLTMRKMEIKENMTPIDRKCIEQGITRTELSRRSGVPIRTLEAWGKRIRIPRDVYVLYKVAQALGCHIEDLIEPELGENE